MTSQELTRRIIFRLLKLKWLIVLAGICFATLLFFYAKSKPVFYTAKSSFYPLSSPASNSSNKLIEQIGGGGGSKSLTDDANINIEEVAKSKKTREAVAAEKLPAFENKTIAELLIIELNKDRSYFAEEIKIPKVDTALYALGAELLKTTYTAKFSKTNLLEIYFTSKNIQLLQPITIILTNKVINFYKELKIKKAKIDFQFLQAKVDSFNLLLAQFDKKRIVMDNTTLFVSPGKMKYLVPKENLENLKNLVTAQRNSAVYNREEANLRLQKDTPVIDMLDSPTPPYDAAGTSKVIYAAIGFIFGIFFSSFLFTVGLLFRFSNSIIKNTIAEKIAVPVAP